jgi:DNA-binding response OmpR family regulator
VRVLVVDDEPLIREVLAEELQAAGFEVCEAATGDDAAEMTAAHPPPDLLLTDIHMPGTLDGFALGGLMRSRFPGLSVLYITGRPDRVRPLGSGEALVLKPFTSDELLRTIRTIMPGSIH